MSRFYSFVLAGALFLSVAPLQAQTSTQAPLAAPARVLGPSGLRREAGTWLFNDSIFVSNGENVVAPGSPVFIANLRRDKKNKLPRFMPTATRGPLNWATLPLPSLGEMMQPNFDFAALQTRLATQVNQAKAKGRLYVGWALESRNAWDATNANLPSKAAATPVLKHLRTVLDAISPEAALILEVETQYQGENRTVAEIDMAAPFCDAILLKTPIFQPDDLWPLKMARRVVEEQKDYDLPLIVQPTPPEFPEKEWDARLLEFFMGGASGFIVSEAETPPWALQIARNPGLFSQAVTLEDVAILPSQNPRTLQIADDLRAVGRIPLVGRLPEGDKKGESLIAVLDDQTTLETLNGLDKAARNGASLYLEGIPDLKNKALLDKLADMTSTTLEVLPASINNSLSMDDPWLFGDARGQEFDVTQRLKWSVKSSLAAQTRVKKGQPSPLPFAAAKLVNDANGLLSAPVGDGHLLWLPHVPTPTSNATARRSFYSAIAGNLQSALVSWKFASGDETHPQPQLRVALRASKTGTPIVAIFNPSQTVANFSNPDASILLSVRSDAPVALDLSSEKELTAPVVGYSSTVPVTISAGSWRWFAFGPTRAALDKERLTPRPKDKS